MPYHIWVSEIMLQQTRVDQARPYFERFIEAFPTVNELAFSSLDDVLVNWEGLGYYSRARNLHKAAKQIVEFHNGELPGDYEGLLKLPGIGPYTAAAISSIAFGQPNGVLDGNVIRVLSRVTCNSNITSSTRTKRVLQAAADSLVDPENPGDFNQAMMELGATVCTPQKPACNTCPVRSLCCAFGANTVDLFPVVKKKPPIPHFDIATGILKDEHDRFLVRKRPEDQMLGGMWEFPSEKRRDNESLEDAISRHFLEEYELTVEALLPVHTLKHAYSHFKITVHAFVCQVKTTDKTIADQQDSVTWASSSELNGLAFHRAQRKLIEHIQTNHLTPTLFG